MRAALSSAGSSLERVSGIAETAFLQGLRVRVVVVLVEDDSAAIAHCILP